MRISFLRFPILAVMIASPCSPAWAQAPDPKSMSIWVQREYNTWDNPLHSEVAINGTTINIFTSDTMENISEYLKDGWNTITVTTTPQQPANRRNELIFRIGPTSEEPARNRVVMQPVLWEFRNGSDWRFKDGAYSHPLGPGTKEVTQTYDLYWAGLQHVGGELKAGDYILTGKPTYNSWTAPVTATVLVNGTPLNTFTIDARQVIITSMLKPGKNEIKLVSSRVENSIRNNDIEFAIAGPAEWNVQRNQFVVTPIVQFKTMQGWKMDPKTGMLMNPLEPGADKIERVIPFFMKKPDKR
ncbi:MAG TPA: hypothetical protein VMO26_16940 [Vicinamibacterales bacterium]|nr:hypothetical protein [Vicinamibacterales bacterium]